MKVIGQYHSEGAGFRHAGTLAGLDSTANEVELCPTMRSNSNRGEFGSGATER